MSKYFIEGTTLTDIADAIRLKRDIVDEINPEDMPLEISLIDGGGGGGFIEGEFTSGNFNTQKTIPVSNPDNKSYIMIVVNKKYSEVRQVAMSAGKTYVAYWIVHYNAEIGNGNTLNICFNASGSLAFYNGGNAVTATSTQIGGVGASLPANTAEWRNFKTYLLFVDNLKDT